ncbi:MAG: hypothetical protein CO109_08705 [Deltaproteobacteria bacterium CG_4_9_14_3_um_filter_65_9]|nr:MAG: hypothetical protein CO109_08705 [Deltaproteobacteria bacterium CG_4_9_14_3_um_filter_65_9]
MNPLPYFVQSPLLRSVPEVYHAFLGVDPVEGRGRRERLREVFSLAAETVGTLKQVHSASVLFFEPGDGDVPGGWKREGDALWTEVPGTGVGVHTADCVPILLAHPKIRVVAAVHDRDRLGDRDRVRGRSPRAVTPLPLLLLQRRPAVTVVET